MHEDDLSASTESRLGTTTDTVEHSEDTADHPDPGETAGAAAGEPEFTGEVPSFTDWREELRERLKRIRARREEERIAAGGAEDGDDALEADAELEADAAPDTELSDEEAPADADEVTEEEVLEAADEAVEEEAAAEEEVEEQAVAEETPDAAEVLEAEVEVAAEEAREDEQPAADEQVTIAAVQTGGQLLEQLVGDRVGDADTITLDADAVTLDADAINLDADAFDNLAEIIDLGAISRDSSGEDHGTADAEGLDELEIAAADDDAEINLDMVDEVAESILDELKFHDAAASDEVAVEEVLPPEPEEAEAGEDLAVDLDEAEVEEDQAPEPEEAEAGEDLAVDLDEAEAEEDQVPEPEEAAAEEDLLAEIEKIETTADTEADEEAAETFDFDEAAIDLPSESAGKEVELPAAVMPDVPQKADAAPELDFAPGTAVVMPPTPEIDVAQAEASAHDLTWDTDATGTASHPSTRSSAGPLGERAAAAVCDMMVLLAIAGTLVSSAASVTGATLNQILSDAALPLAGAWSIFAIGYSVFFVGSCGQTIGRMVMRLRVVHNDQFSVGFKAAALRLAAWLVSIATLGLGILPAIKDRQNRALHDRLSKTRVVKA